MRDQELNIVKQEKDLDVILGNNLKISEQCTAAFNQPSPALPTLVTFSDLQRIHR